MPYKDPEIRKAKAKEYSRKHYLKNKAKHVKRVKDNKHANSDREREYDRKSRRRKDPTIKIGDAVRVYREGDISFDELNRRIERVVDECDEISRSKKQLCESASSGISEGVERELKI